MKKEIYYIVSPHHKIKNCINSKDSRYNQVITSDAWGVVLDAYEKDYENYFRCAFPAKIFFIAENGKTIERIERKIVDLKQSEVRVIGWGHAPFEEDYWEQRKGSSTEFFESEKLNGW